MSSKFNILVVEDEPVWAGYLAESLEKRFASTRRFAWTSVTNAQDAWNQLALKRYHLVSIDQNIPRQKNGVVNAANGLGFCQQMVERQVLSQRIIFTGSGKMHYSNWAGRLDGTPYLEKSTTGIDSPETNIYSARGWAEFVQTTLEKEYLPYALRETGKGLPLAFAERARRTLASYENGLYEAYIRLWIELWESTLHLHSALALALCNSAGIVLNTLPEDTPTSMQDIVREAWPKLDRANWMKPLLRYIGDGSKESGLGVGTHFLNFASDPLRRLRNELAHRFSQDLWRDKAEQNKDVFLVLIDAMAFWHEHPLLIGLRFHHSTKSRVIGDAIAGDQFPFRARDIDAPGINQLPSPNTESPSVIWFKSEDDTRIVLLDPFIILSRERSSGRQIVSLLSHPNKRNGAWMYRSLSDGSMEERKLSPSQQGILDAVLKYR